MTPNTNDIFRFSIVIVKMVMPGIMTRISGKVQTQSDETKMYA